MDAELEFAIQPNTTGKQLFDQVIDFQFITFIHARRGLASLSQLFGLSRKNEFNFML